ncbi:Protein GLUTAMINE DUMPER like [Quillaja saponaria]|uniref:Protein GLUTAMINE DUMPER like n=1 Tax=Quillaja saponaria TaxID=32244 RepID=A0AAD7VKX9_QUISA|nr:Protein GLUTAMINE DUMPER like [Quillaja saponaria]
MTTFHVTAKPPVEAQPHSPWHSPVPYLFGGLAAMLGLIAFALFILACSYWKLSGYLDENGGGEGERDLEAGEGNNSDETQKASPVYEEKFLVIMAGQEKPTYLATPISSTSTSRSSSFGDNSSSTCSCGRSEKSVELAETVKQGSGNDQVQSEQQGNP